jgi:hypothetical protein
MVMDTMPQLPRKDDSELQMSRERTHIFCTFYAPLRVRNVFHAKPDAIFNQSEANTVSPL